MELAGGYRGKEFTIVGFDECCTISEEELKTITSKFKEKEMNETDPKHPPSMLDLENLDNWFSYHSPTPEQTQRYNLIRNAAKQFASVIMENTPKSADQTAALRKLREVVMSANLTIACNEN